MVQPPPKRPSPWWTVLAIALGASLALLSFPALKAWISPDLTVESQQEEVGLETVFSVARLLQEEYIKQLDTRQLLSGALEAMKEGLKAAGAEPVPLPPLPRTSEPGLLEGAFTARFTDALKAGLGVVSTRELTYMALGGLAEAVGDPYTTVLDPEQYEHMNEQMKGGNFGGVGIYLEAAPNQADGLTVVEPIEGGPAHEAGVRSGDRILSIDGLSTRGMDIEAAAARIRGEAGTKVELTLKRAGAPSPLRVALTRQKIHIKSATSKLLPGRLGYIRLRFFGDETAEEFTQALERVRREGARGLVLDLRNNGGGYINAALDVISHFVQKGDVVVSVVNPRNERNDPHLALGSSRVDLPVVVLVNQFSASAAEITAGALKDLDQAWLIGKNTFGKASVQSMHLLADGGAVKYTIAHYLTPSGRDIHRNGIPPHLEVDFDPAGRFGSPEDAQLKAAVRHLEERLSMAAAPQAR